MDRNELWFWLSKLAQCEAIRINWYEHEINEELDNIEAAQQGVHWTLLPCGHTKEACWDDVRNICVACEVAQSH